MGGINNIRDFLCRYSFIFQNCRVVESKEMCYLILHYMCVVCEVKFSIDGNSIRSVTLVSAFRRFRDPGLIFNYV